MPKTIKLRPLVRASLPAVPLSQLPIMKASMGLPACSKAGVGKRTRAGDPKALLATLIPTIVDKLQILALRRPRALIIIAEVLDGLLKRQLEVLDDYPRDRGGVTKPRLQASRTRRPRTKANRAATVVPTKKTHSKKRP